MFAMFIFFLLLTSITFWIMIFYPWTNQVVEIKPVLITNSSTFKILLNTFQIQFPIGYHSREINTTFHSNSYSIIQHVQTLDLHGFSRMDTKRIGKERIFAKAALYCHLPLIYLLIHLWLNTYRSADHRHVLLVH